MSNWHLTFDLDASRNLFRDRFGGLSDDEWYDMLTASIADPLIEGVEFPHFATDEVQQWSHGSTGEVAMREAAAFYKFVAAKDFFRRKAQPGANFLDFGAGWGRIGRFFLRDFDLDCLYGFETQRSSAFRARSLNPYFCILTGPELPDQKLPADCFDLMVGWSVFSHLSEASTSAWLGELARMMRPDGFCVMTTFGEQFLAQLLGCASALARGEEVHWFHRHVLEAAGDIADRRDRYRRGEFVWISDDPNRHFGLATFLPDKALQTLIKRQKLPLELVEFDHHSLNMDTFILRRR
jgi:hypothetical protein